MESAFGLQMPEYALLTGTWQRVPAGGFSAHACARLDAYVNTPTQLHPILKPAALKVLSVYLSP